MSGKESSANKLKALFDNKIFIEELQKVKLAGSENQDVKLIQLKNNWKLTWEYYETLVEYLNTGKIDFTLGDKDIKVIDYKARTLTPSNDPKNEFGVMEALHQDGINRGVYLRIPKEAKQSDLNAFIKKNWNLIKGALDNNYPGRISVQSPEQQTERKVAIYKMHRAGKSNKQIAAVHSSGDERYIRAVIKEYKDKILD